MLRLFWFICRVEFIMLFSLCQSLLMYLAVIILCIYASEPLYFLAWGYGEHEIIFLHFRIVISLESRKNLELLEVCLFWNMDSIWLILSRWNGGCSVIGGVLMVPLCEYHIQHSWTKLLLLVGEPVVINNSLALDSLSLILCVGSGGEFQWEVFGTLVWFWIIDNVPISVKCMDTI